MKFSRRIADGVDFRMIGRVAHLHDGVVGLRDQDPASFVVDCGAERRGEFSVEGRCAEGYERFHSLVVLTVAGGIHAHKPCRIRRHHPRTHQTFVTGDRFGSILDPFGQRWTVMTRVEDVSPEERDRRMAEWAKENVDS